MKKKLLVLLVIGLGGLSLLTISQPSISSVTDLVKFLQGHPDVEVTFDKGE